MKIPCWLSVTSLEDTENERTTAASLISCWENGKAMPSLSAPGREKDQRGGEKVAAEEKPRDMSLEDAAVELTFVVRKRKWKQPWRSSR